MPMQRTPWLIGLGVVIASGLLVPGVLADKPDGDGKKTGTNPGAGGGKSEPRKLKIGQRKGETDEKFEKRRALMLKNTEKDDVNLYTLMKGVKPFVVRTDISAEFTVDTALFMEQLHRDYKEAYRRMGLPPGEAKELIEVVVYSDQATYKENGGSEGSGGQFMQAVIFKDRPPNWPVKHYRLMQFTNGETEFEKWHKGVLQHEAAHMELQLRLGFLVDSPRWWNEGQATCFEYWDFNKSVDENLELIPSRGRYAPVVRRLYGTEKFKPFSYVWEIDAAAWHGDMTAEQGGLNYAQAWSLAAFMLNQGREGRAAFKQIFGLSKRVGADRAVSGSGTKTRAWEVQFPRDEQKKMEDNWIAWIEKNLPKDKRNADEEEGLLAMGYDPREEELVEFTKETYAAYVAEKEKKEGKKKGEKDKSKGKKKGKKPRPPADDGDGETPPPDDESGSR